MRQDGNTIVGQMSYSTCSGFVRAGFIFTGGTMYDLYDWVEAQGLDLDAAGYGVYGQNLPCSQFCHIGAATDISEDGMTLVGAPILDPDAPGPWVIHLNAASGACIPPAIITQPNATTNFTACTSSANFTINVTGQGPLSFQWKKNGSNIAAGSTGNNTYYQISQAGKRLQVDRVAVFGDPVVTASLAQADAGTYTCTLSNACGGTTVTSNNAVLQVDPALVAINNDNCSGADLPANILTTGSNLLGASGTSVCAAWTNDPDTSFCLVSAPRNDRWYKFVPAVTQNYRLETCGANIDTTLAIYDACPDMGGSQISGACNNDRDTGPATHTGSATACAAQRSRIGSISLTAGTPYYIRVGALLTAGLSSSSATNLSILAAPSAPANNTCGGATVAALGMNAIDTNEATNDSTVSCSAVSGTRDVWLVYTPPTGTYGLLSATTCSTTPATSWNTVLTLFNGCGGSELGCNDDTNVNPCFSQSTISNVAVTGDTPYYIRVAGNSATAFGTGAVNLTYVPKGSCCTPLGACSVTTQAACTGASVWHTGGTCDTNTCPCPGDFNASRFVDADDLFDFLDAWFASNPSTPMDMNWDVRVDLDQNNQIDADDLFTFLDLWFATNPTTCP
jgi:hypothetical protein